MQLNSKIVEARWDPSEGIYNLTVENPKTKEQRKEWSHVLVNGSGMDTRFSPGKGFLLTATQRHTKHLEMAGN